MNQTDWTLIGVASGFAAGWHLPNVLYWLKHRKDGIFKIKFRDGGITVNGYALENGDSASIGLNGLTITKASKQ